MITLKELLKNALLRGTPHGSGAGKNWSSKEEYDALYGDKDE